MEVEFTKPLGTDAAAAAKFQVRQWRYVPTSTYGGPKVDDVALAVQKVTLSADGLKATLEIAGLKAGSVVHITLKDLKSKAAEIPWGADAYYTLNAFGPADKVVAIKSDRSNGVTNGKQQVLMEKQGSGMVMNQVRGSRPVRVLSADGKVLRDFSEKVLP